MKVKVNFNRFPQVRAEVPRALQARLGDAAEGLRNTISDALDSNAISLHSDTGAMAKSMAVQTKGALGESSDAQKRIGEARVAYLATESRYADAVRAKLTPEAYTAEHFDERVADEQGIESNATAAAAVTTLWGVAALWELGHFNQLTERDEHRPFMQPLSAQWAMTNLTGYFGNLLKG